MDLNKARSETQKKYTNKKTKQKTHIDKAKLVNICFDSVISWLANFR